MSAPLLHKPILGAGGVGLSAGYGVVHLLGATGLTEAIVPAAVSSIAILIAALLSRQGESEMKDIRDRLSRIEEHLLDEKDENAQHHTT